MLVDSATVQAEFAEGAADVDGAPLSTDMHFRIASNTKALTCTVVLQQVDAGVIALDDEIVEFAPGSDIIADISTRHDLSGLTFENLCRHTSGLGEYYGGSLEQAFVNEPGRVFSKQELLDAGLAQPRLGEVGEIFAYSNTGFVLLEVALEAATGASLADLYQEVIFDPLGMTETSYPAAEDIRLPEPHPRGYATPLSPDGTQDAERGPQDVTELSPSMGYAGGGAVSTLADLARFVEAAATGELLSAAGHERQWQTVPIDAMPYAHYGIGVMQFGPYRGHSGEIPGFITSMLHNPDTGTTIVVMLNSSDRSGVSAQSLALAIGAIVDGDDVPWTVDEIMADLFRP